MFKKLCCCKESEKKILELEGEVLSFRVMVDRLENQLYYARKRSEDEQKQNDSLIDRIGQLKRIISECA